MYSRVASVTSLDIFVVMDPSSAVVGLDFMALMLLWHWRKGASGP